MRKDVIVYLIIVYVYCITNSRLVNIIVCTWECGAKFNGCMI